MHLQSQPPGVAETSRSLGCSGLNSNYQASMKCVSKNGSGLKEDIGHQLMTSAYIPQGLVHMINHTHTTYKKF